ncbi:MAG: alpha/beta hydrolase [Proteobacteria bacterium]|nr:alpha/beta hydrolase [Pseudomonadota bacterium]
MRPPPEDRVYAEADGAALLARIYRPAGNGPFPAVLEVHGGAWVNGDRLNNVAIAEALAEAGILVVSVDFRMPPVAAYPVPVADVNRAIRWLKAHAEELGTRPELVGALGTSSGGHLLLLNVLRPHDARYAALPVEGGGAQDAPMDATVAFAIVCWPVADPLTRYRVMRERGNERLVDAHHRFWPDEAAMEEGSPQGILERGEPVHTPRLLIMQGTKDDNLTPDMASRFAQAYAMAGGEATLRLFPGMPHAFIAPDPESPAARAALRTMVGFIRS